MLFSEKVKYVRGKLFLTQKELAKELGVTQVTVARWETRSSSPQFLKAQKFQKYCESKGIKFGE